jgi:arylsulfatase A-like enzyme
LLASELSRKAPRPNFLFIVTDDQRYDAMGCAGNPLVRTPNIDALAARGTRFDRAFVTLSICSPSRAACLTGCYGSANGVTSVPGTLSDPRSTIAWRLKEAGYRTGVVGKWHLGNSPAECGFDFASYFVSNGSYYGRSVTENGCRKKARGYIEDYNAQQATQFMADCHSAGAPFFLFYCTQVPHMNHEFDWPARAETLARYDPQDMPIPQTWQDDLAGKPPYLKAARSREQALHYGYDQKENIQRHFQRYYATITEMDAALGPVLGALDELSLREDTYVFLMGDNGWFMGEHGFTSKVLPYEESIRVPMLAAGPGVRTGLDSRLVLNIDIPPTILELAGLPLPETVHGASLVPLLCGKPCRWRTSFLYEAPTPSLGSWPLYAVRTQRWKYIQTFDKTDRERPAFEELYDLHADPHETTNLVGQAEHADRQATLKRELQRLRDSLRS